ncbi:MAG: type II keratin, basic [Parcubacteria group bacterium Gr01-1014_49]|nr:MAG: type II keratin, basic [Parcubacteria group bacterium Gr01-1014_49]
MKSTVRATLVLAAFLLPALAFAQPWAFPIPAMPTAGFNYSGSQGFSGGVFGTFGGGGAFGGFGGFGGLGGGFGAGGFGVAGIAITIINIINGVLVPLLFAISFIVFLYGIAKAYIFSPGDEEAIKTGHKIILWGLLGFAAMVSVWGLVGVVVNTFGLAGPVGSATSFGPR